MQAKPPSLRRYVGYNKEQSLSYMTRMVCNLSWSKLSCFCHIEILLGEELAPSVTHLVPSVNVSQIVKDTSKEVFVDMQQISEGYTRYWAPNYIWWKWLHLPWFSRLWIWCNWRVGGCLKIHWEAVCYNWSERSVTCNLVSFLDFSLSWVTIIFSGIVYQWTALVPFHLQNLDSSIKGQEKVSARVL